MIGKIPKPPEACHQAANIYRLQIQKLWDLITSSNNDTTSSSNDITSSHNDTDKSQQKEE
jgi:hypothetical protein